LAPLPTEQLRAPDQTLDLLRLSRWGELDSLHQSLDLVSLALTGDSRDCGNDVGITQVIIQVDFYFWTILWVWRCASSGLLQDEGSQFAEVISKGSRIIDDDIDKFSVEPDPPPMGMRILKSPS
jgi:uncharacterized membrane protein